MASKRISFCAKALLAVLLLSAIPALAQTIVSTLRGRVTDPQGAVVVGATVCWLCIAGFTVFVFGS